jgi:cyclohexyl-isocyanide hydratase
MTQPFQIGFLLFPGLTQLDLTGPAQVLSRTSNSETHFVAATLAPVPSDCGLSLSHTKTFETCPPLDLVCVPGGIGVNVPMRDAGTMAWLKAQGERAQLVTSVCTGSLILGAAGLLKGYRAACHWAWRDLLTAFGATPVAERVVIDRNRITGGGVTAGIDFAFETLARLRGPDEAETIRLVLEYDPRPYGTGGTPDTARPEVVDLVRTRMAGQGMAARRADLISIAKERGFEQGTP